MAWCYVAFMMICLIVNQNWGTTRLVINITFLDAIVSFVLLLSQLLLQLAQLKDGVNIYSVA